MLTVRTNPIFQRNPEDAQRELTERSVLRRASGRRRMVSALHSRNAVKEIDTLPAPEETLHVVCRGNFALFSVIAASLQMASPAIIESLSVATLGFSKSNVADLLEMLDAGRVRSVSIVASVYFERQNPSEYRMMAEGLAVRGHRLVALRSHAKVLAFKFSDSRAFAIESSANLRSCRNLEQFTLTQSPDLYEFHTGWIAQVIEAAAGMEARR
jgi:hypothetical protein